MKYTVIALVIIIAVLIFGGVLQAIVAIGGAILSKPLGFWVFILALIMVGYLIYWLFFD